MTPGKLRKAWSRGVKVPKPLARACDGIASGEESVKARGIWKIVRNNNKERKTMQLY